MTHLQLLLMRSEIKLGFKALQANSSPGISCEQTEYISPHGLVVTQEIQGSKPLLTVHSTVITKKKKNPKHPEYTVKLLISKDTEKVKEILGY